jgi:hypothetical protein
MKTAKRTAKGSVALMVVVLFAAFVLYHDAHSTPGEASLAVHAQGASPAATLQTQTLVSGLWRVDGAFESTIRIKNSLIVGPIDVSPVLYYGRWYGIPLTCRHRANGGNGRRECQPGAG